MVFDVSFGLLVDELNIYDHVINLFGTNLRNKHASQNLPSHGV